MAVFRHVLEVLLILMIVTPVIAVVGTVTEDIDDPDSFGRRHRDPYDIKDYKDHPCLRPCTETTPRKTCRYYFLLEHFTTMSKACYDCPRNKSHCSLPQCVTGDGQSRGVLTANRMVPGPTIDVCKDDIIEVMLDNRMELGEGTSIHWHGLRQLGSPHMDGTNLVTQCPVHTWAKMKYRFMAADEGTHFWHSHSSIQRSEGLFGGLVIRAPRSLDPQSHLYDHDLPEHYLVLSDWTAKTTAEEYAQDFHSDLRAEPSSILINGLGKPTSTDDKDYKEMPFPEFRVKPGQRYRFRLAFNGILNCPIYIKVDDHPLLVISTDARNIEPVEVDALMIFSGERYDFVLQTKKHCDNSHWIRFKGHGRCAGSVFQAAILRYEGTADPKGEATIDNTFEDNRDRMLNGRYGESTEKRIMVADLEALGPDTDPDVLKEKPDKQYYVSVGSSAFQDKRFEPPPLPHFTTMEPQPVRPVNQQLNYISSRLPPSPPLTQYDEIPKEIFCNNDTVEKDCSQELCNCVHVLTFELGEVAELALVSFRNTLIHPFHMHGHSFRVVSQYSFNRDITVAEVKAMDQRGEIPRRRSGAPFKDTIAAHAQAVTILRFRADNPGFWFFHCHIEFHTEVGMALIIQVGKPEDMPPPPRGFPACHSWDPRDEQNIQPLDASKNSRLFKNSDGDSHKNIGDSMHSQVAKAKTKKPLKATKPTLPKPVIAVVASVLVITVVAIVVGVIIRKRQRLCSSYPRIGSRNREEYISLIH